MKTKTLKLNDYELSELYSLVFGVLDKDNIRMHKIKNPYLKSAVEKLNYAMSSQQPYDSK